MKINLIDLSRQYELIKEEVEKKVIDVMRSSNYIMGKEVREFEEKSAEYFNVKHAISVANGTDALILSLRAMNIKKGDEVITTPFTFFASSESIKRVGAVPVFVDIDKDTLNIDPAKIEEKITNKTRAIMPVHIFGNPCDMDAIQKIANKHNLAIIEDACQAFGAEYNKKRIGSISDVSCFSFFPTKNLGGMGDGGLITTNSDEIADVIKALKNHGSGKEGQKAYELLNGKDSLKDDLIIREGFEKYYNYLIGYNSRLDEMQAAVLNIKIKYIDEWNRNRRNIAEQYHKSLNEKYVMQKSLDNAYPIYHMFTLQNENRETIIKKLNDAQISAGIYYPVPLHYKKVFKDLNYKKGDFPVVEEICNKVFSIPVFPELTKEEQTYIIDKLL